MNVKVNEIITVCFSLGIMISINQRLDGEIITLLAENFGYEVEFVSADVQEDVVEEIDDPKDLAEKIMWALENDCSKIVDQAWQDVQEYTWDKRAEKIVRWMEELGTFDHKGITSLSNQGELP